MRYIQSQIFESKKIREDVNENYEQVKSLLHLLKTPPEISLVNFIQNGTIIPLVCVRQSPLTISFFTQLRNNST